MKIAKVWYFSYFSALSCLFPFLNLYFRNLGLGERHIGLLGAARPLVSLPAGALWCAAADRTRLHRAVLLLCFAGSAAARLAIGAVGAAWGARLAPLFATVVATEAFAAPVTIIVDSAVMAACSAEGAYGRQRLWGALGWGLCSALAGVLITHAGVYAAFACHAVLLVAALPATLRLPFGPLHAKLAAHTQHDDGGGGDGGDGGGGMGGKDGGSKAGTAEQSPKPAAHAASGRRSVERFDSALEAAALLERGAGGHTHAGSCRGGSKGVCAGADEEEAAQLSQQDGSASAAGQQPRVQYWAGVGQLLRCPEAAIFLAMAITMGFGVGNIEGYLFLYLDELGGSEALMGLSLSVTCAAETLVFYHQNHLLRLGVRRCMHLVLAAFLVRMGAYAALAHAPSPWLVLPIEVLHGFTFALAWGGGCAYCAQLAPPGLEATTQGLFQGLYFGLGVAAGSAVGGHVYQRHGAQAVYVVACGVLAAGWALCSAAQAAVALFGRGSGDGSSPGYLRVAAVEMGGRSDSSSLDPPPGVKREASAERITGGIAAAASV